MKACFAAGALVAALGLVSVASAQDVLQVRAKAIVLADGSRLENGILVVADGKVRSVGTGELDDTQPWIDHDGVLTAGLVACQTLSGAKGEGYDTTRQLLPEARMVHAFQPHHSDFERALKAGITTVVLTPTDQNLAGGQTAVVKTSGGEVLSDQAHLSLSFTGAALSGSVSGFNRFFGSGEPDGYVGAARDGGLENTAGGRRGSRPPTSYGGALRVLDEQMAAGEGAFGRAQSGDLAVFLTAWDRHEVARAASFATRHGLKGAVRGAPLAGDEGLLPTIQASGLAVVLGPFQVGHQRRSLDSVKKLHDAGVAVGFALDAPTSGPEDFRLSGALAVSAGADPTQVLRSMTSTGATIAGVADRVGSLEPGKDADFVLWSGDPLDLGSRVEAVYVGGARAWRSE